MADDSSDPQGGSSVNLQNIWVGVGLKVGGFLGALGATSLNGAVWRCDGPPSASALSFTVTEFQIGLGLGGGANIGILYAFGTPSLYSLNNSWGSWSPTANVSLPDVDVSGLFAPLQNLKALTPATLSALDPNTLGGLVNWATAVYQTQQAESASGSGWGTFDIPVGSCGVEAMAGFSKSQLMIS